MHDWFPEVDTLDETDTTVESATNHGDTVVTEGQSIVGWNYGGLGFFVVHSPSCQGIYKTTYQ